MVECKENEIDNIDKEELFYYSKSMEYLLKWHDVLEDVPKLGEVVRVTDGINQMMSKLVLFEGEQVWDLVNQPNVNEFESFMNMTIEYWQHIVPTPQSATKFSKYVH